MFNVQHMYLTDISMFDECAIYALSFLLGTWAFRRLHYLYWLLLYRKLRRVRTMYSYLFYVQISSPAGRLYRNEAKQRKTSLPRIFGEKKKEEERIWFDAIQQLKHKPTAGR